MKPTHHQAAINRTFAKVLRASGSRAGVVEKTRATILEWFLDDFNVMLALIMVLSGVPPKRSVAARA